MFLGNKFIVLYSYTQQLIYIICTAAIILYHYDKFETGSCELPIT